MSFKSIAITLLATAAPLASAIGAAVVKNSCPFPVYLSAVGATASPVQTLPPAGGSFSEAPFFVDPKTGGRTIKITREADGLFTGKPQLNFAYTLDGANVWYDLSNVFGDAFAGYKIVEKSVDAGCGVIVWPAGANPGGPQVKVCGSGSDVVLELCAP
ncbi:bys1 domain-containing protein [Venturia nashicola]|uniref:Bys1 domain-containing protein n=1 Tax=Venturia nashicola TaxID=86259 RepID=A0A4Z1P9Y6_9PEZI|nr:bys1 domain-containing protein [Venturia nashicola]TLD27416.1 bys1 domain-containing protein [Venturia nashicola]